MSCAGAGSGRRSASRPAEPRAMKPAQTAGAVLTAAPPALSPPDAARVVADHHAGPGRVDGDAAPIGRALDDDAEQANPRPHLVVPSLAERGELLAATRPDLKFPGLTSETPLPESPGAGILAVGTPCNRFVQTAHEPGQVRQALP